MLHVGSMPGWEQDVAMMAEPPPPREWRREMWLTGVEGRQGHAMIPGDYPVTVGVVNRKLLNTLPSSEYIGTAHMLRSWIRRGVLTKTAVCAMRVHDC